jgi:hypothetical protein
MEMETQEHSEPEFQSEEDLASEVQPEEHLELEDQAEVFPETAPRKATLRLDLLATLIVGVMVGIVIGYLGRPLVASEPQRSTPSRAENVADSPTSAGPTATPESSASNASAQTLMDAMIAQTRHFRGDASAPVTIIEFSDFQ